MIPSSVSPKPRNNNNNACKASADPAGYSPAAAPAPRAGKREGRRGTGVPMPPTVPGDRPSGKEDLPPPLITSTASDRGSSALHFRARRNRTSRSKSSRSCKQKRMCAWGEGRGCFGGSGQSRGADDTNESSDRARHTHRRTEGQRSPGMLDTRHLKPTPLQALDTRHSSHDYRLALCTK